MTHKIEQLVQELNSVIRRHLYENRICTYHIVAALEALKFELLYQAFIESENEGEDKP